MGDFFKNVMVPAITVVTALSGCVGKLLGLDGEERPGPAEGEAG